MALSGSFSGSIAGGKYKLRVDWSATQSVSNNASKVTAVMYLVQASGWSLNVSSRDDNKATINGAAITWTSPAISNSGGKTTKLGTVTSGNITHNADGTKSITISAVYNIKATISGTYYSSITASDTVTLNTIPRATQPTLSKSSADMGSAVTITLPRASSSFTHNLTFDLTVGDLSGSGGVSEVYSGTITTGAGASYAWTVPDLATYLPDNTQATAAIRCVTKNGSTTVGTKYAYLTVKVPSSVAPAAPSLAVQEATSGLAAQFGAYIQNKSTLSVSVAATGIKGSTITAYQTTVNGKTYTGSSFTTGLLTKSGTVSLTCKVKDSRGRWSAAKTVNVTVLAYSPPKATTLVARRVDTSGNADEQGTRLMLTYAYSVTSLGSKNTVSMVISYKRSTATSWAQLLTGTALSASTTAKPSSPTFSVDYQYDIRLTVTDWFGASSTYQTILPSGAVILDLLASGKGIAFGRAAEEEGVSFGWDILGKVSSMSSQAGQWQLPGGPLIQWGTVEITPTAANVVATAALTYSVAYSATPITLLTSVTSVPGKVGVGITDRATTGCTVNLLRTDGTTKTVIFWLAIGKAA